MRNLTLCLWLFLQAFFTLHAQQTDPSILIRELRLTDIAYHPPSDRLYGSVADDRPDGNAVLVMHPASGNIVDRIPVGMHPHLLRFSHDYRYLYVSYFLLNRIDRIDLNTKERSNFARFTDTRTTFGELEEYANIIYDFHVLPNDPEALIVSKSSARNFPDASYVLIYSNGDTLPQTINKHNVNGRYMAHHPGTNHYYAYGDGFEDKKVWRYQLGPDGVTFDAEFEMLDREYNQFKIFEDRLYGERGEVYDLSSGTPDRIGNFNDLAGKRAYDGEVAIDPFSKNIYSIDYQDAAAPQGAGTFIYQVDPVDLTILHQTKIPQNIGTSIKMIHTGEAGRFAMITHLGSFTQTPMQGKLVLVGGCQNTDSSALQITVSASQVCLDDTLTFTASGNFDSYIWSTGQEGKVVQIDFPYGRNISVNAYNDEGCLQGVSDELEIEPVQPASIDRDRRVFEKCRGDSVLLEVKSRDSRFKYVWSDGRTGHQIYAIDPGRYQVTAYRGPDCTDHSFAEYLVGDYFGGIPPAGELLHEDTVWICPGKTTTLSARNPTYRYRWGFNDGNFYPGAQIETVSNPGVYKVRYATLNDCMGPVGDSVVLALYDQVNAPNIYIHGDSLLFSTTKGRKLWYMNGRPLVGYTSDSLIATERGFYTVRLLSEDGCISPNSTVIKVENPYLEQPRYIRSELFVDYNDDGRFNGDDIYLSSQRILLEPSGEMRFTNDQGAVQFRVEAGVYQLFAEVDESLWRFSNNRSQQLVDTDAATDSVYTFRLIPKTEEVRAEVVLTSGITRCSREAAVNVFLINRGAKKFDGEVCLELDPAITSLRSMMGPVDPIPAELCFTVSDVGVGEQTIITHYIGVPNYLFIGDTLTFLARALHDNKVIDRTSVDSEIRCSYDPNDKLVAPARGPGGQYVLFGDTMQYTIRFQNTGNDTAFLVRLTDQLSEDLWWPSFEPVAASHPHEVSLELESGQLTVLFEDILLPDSFTNYDGSQGFFTFRILPRAGLPENTLLENEAYIYFDFNPPVITNTVQSEMVTQLPTSTRTNSPAEQFHSFRMVPNPTRGNIIIQSPILLQRPAMIEFYNTQGKLILRTALAMNKRSWPLNIEDWPAGAFYYSIRDAANGQSLDGGILIHAGTDH